MKRYQAVIFDLDGTLLDTLDDLRDAVNATMEHFGYPGHTREEIRSFVGNGVERLIELSIPGGREDPRFAEAVTFYRAYYPAHAEIKTAPYPGVTELIRELNRDGIATAVVSNKPHISTTKLCARYFPEIGYACGEREAEGIRRKPAPDTVLFTAKELGIAVEDCVYIGDSEVDVETAKNAGMDCIAVLWGFRDREVLEAAGAELFASDAAELGKRIRGA